MARDAEVFQDGTYIAWCVELDYQEKWLIQKRKCSNVHIKIDQKEFSTLAMSLKKLYVSDFKAMRDRVDRRDFLFIFRIIYHAYHVYIDHLHCYPAHHLQMAWPKLQHAVHFSSAVHCPITSKMRPKFILM